MTCTGTCAEIRLELGVYILGAIAVADRRAVDAHLARCADLRTPSLVAWWAGSDGSGARGRGRGQPQPRPDACVSEVVVNDSRPDVCRNGMSKFQFIRTETMQCTTDG